MPAPYPEEFKQRAMALVRGLDETITTSSRIGSGGHAVGWLTLGRRRMVAVALAVGLIASTLVAGAPATAQDGPPVAIESPTDGEYPYGDVTVRIRTSRPDPGLRVTMYGVEDTLQDVTSRFREQEPGLFVGTLRMEHELQVGDNHIYAETSNGDFGVDEAHIHVAREAERPLRLHRRARGRVGRAPIDVFVRGNGTILRATLNGVSADDSFEQRREGSWEARLSAKDGLQYGDNRLVVRVFDGDGQFQEAVDTFVVSRKHPLVDAGPDQHVMAGQGLELDGTLTKAAKDGLGLDLAWQIASKPAGSDPRLVDADTATPRFEPDVAGHYRIQLRARHDQAGGDPERGRSATVIDTVEVTVGPNLPPIGQRVQTMVTQDGLVGIAVGDTHHPMTPGAVVQAVKIDRETLEATSKNFLQGEEGALVAYINDGGSDNFFVLSGGGRPHVFQGPTFEIALSGIGVTLDAESRVIAPGALEDGDWSAVGVPGIPSGQAHQLIGLQQGSGPVGGMDGRLRRTSDGKHYAFNWAAEYHTFDTSRARTNNTNRMVINGRAFSTFIAQSSQYHLVWHDADTLKFRENTTYDATNFFDGDDAGMHGLWQKLREIEADPNPALLFLNTVGHVNTPFYTAKPGDDSPPCKGYDDCPSDMRGSDGNDSDGVLMARITMLLRELGANPYVYAMAGSSHPDDPGTPGGYSLVGVAGAKRRQGPNAAAELSTRLWKDQPIARLTGVLHRNPQGLLTASSTAAPGTTSDPTTFEPDLVRVLNQPPKPFPALDTDGKQAAATYIADQAWHLEPDDTYGYRGLYWQDPSTAWKETTVQDVAPCTSNCPKNYNDTDFFAVREQLATEAGYLDSLNQALITNSDKSGLLDLYQSTFSTDNAEFFKVAQSIRDDYDPPSGDVTGPNIESILSGVLGLSSGIGSMLGPEGAAAAGVFKILAAVASTAAAATRAAPGSSPFDPYGFRSTTATLASDLITAYSGGQDAIRRARDRIAGDWGRLEAAAQLAAMPAADGGWRLDTDGVDQFTTALNLTMSQYMYLTMAQPVYSTYECAIEDANILSRHSDYNAGAVFKTNVVHPELISPNTKYLQTWWNLYPTSIVLAERNHYGWPETVKSSITQTLFTSPDDQAGAQGFRREYFAGSANASDTGHGRPNRDGGDRILATASPGLLHRNMNFSPDFESDRDITQRGFWSMYTPSCGFGQILRWSDPDPNRPTSLVKPTSPHWDPFLNPWKNP